MADADATPPPADQRAPDADATPPPADQRAPDADATPPADQRAPDADATAPPPDADASVPPPDVQPDASICTADNQCPTAKPHCNTSTGVCVAATALVVAPATVTVALGLTQQFTATATFSDTTTANVSAAATWTSSTAATATVSNTGLATTLATGTSTITAAYNGLTATGALTVGAKQLVSVEVTPAGPTNAKGTTRQFTATANYTDNSKTDVSSTATWTSGTTTVATIDAAGLATTILEGTSLITAAFGGQSGSTTLTVTNATLVSLSIGPATPTVPSLTAVPFTVTGRYTDNSNQNLTSQATWTSSNVAIATISDIAGSKGLATTVSAGTTTITASFGGQNATTLLTVTGATLTSINVAPAAPTVAKGLVVTFSATGVYSDSSTQPLTTLVTWTSSDTNVAVISNTAGSQGFATCVAAGPATITATLGAISGTASLTVTAATLVSIGITPTTPSIAKGTTQQFTATGTYTDFTTAPITADVTWGTSNAGVAPISNDALSHGLATGLVQGNATISATLSGITQTTLLTVTNAQLTSIDIAPTNPTIAKGNSRQFTATGHYTDLSTQDLTATATWSSSNLAAATITTSGGLASGVDAGTATITAQSGSTTGSTLLTVTIAQLSAIELSPLSDSIVKGTTRQFTATGRYTDNTTQPLTALASWSSNNGAIATVSSAGLATAKNIGTATITANYNGVSGSASLTVLTKTLSTLVVTPAIAEAPAGTQLQFNATGIYSDSSIQDLTTLVTWTSEADTIATISNDPLVGVGLASALLIGDTTIKATYLGIEGSRPFKVLGPNLDFIEVQLPNSTIPVGATQQVSAIAHYSNSTVVNVTTQASWSSQYSAFATISNAATTEGLATAVSPGTTIITATFNGVSGTASLTVSGATLSAIAVKTAGTTPPVSISIANGTSVQFIAIGTYSDGSTLDITQTVTWLTPPAQAIASISNGVDKGVATGLSVGGPITVSAVLGSAPVITGTAELTVTSATLQTITVAAAVTSTIARGTTQQFIATGHYSGGGTQDLTTQVQWGSGTPSVATVSNLAGSKGLATGSAPGMSSISASLNGVTGATTLTVTAATLNAISVIPADTNLAAGANLQYHAIGSYSDTTTQDITTLVEWEVSAGGFVTISNVAGTQGLAHGVAAGSATITATIIGGVTTGSTSVNITP
jgi:hypothetical protein